MYRRFRDMREDADLSRRELAEKLNIPQTSYTRYETGQREMPLHIAVKLADFYKVSLDYLAGRTDKP